MPLFATALKSFVWWNWRSKKACCLSNEIRYIKRIWGKEVNCIFDSKREESVRTLIFHAKNRANARYDVPLINVFARRWPRKRTDEQVDINLKKKKKIKGTIVQIGATKKSLFWSMIFNRFRSRYNESNECLKEYIEWTMRVKAFGNFFDLNFVF